MGLALVAAAALVAERLLAATVGGQGPDLLIVALLVAVDGARSARAGLLGFGLGALRDLVSPTPLGAFALAYLVTAVALAEFDGAVRFSGGVLRPLLAGALALLAGGLATAFGWIASPAAAFTGDVRALVVCAALTVIAAAVVALLPGSPLAR